MSKLGLIDTHDTGGHGYPKEFPAPGSLESRRTAVLDSAVSRVDQVALAMGLVTVDFAPEAQQSAQEQAVDAQTAAAVAAGHALFGQYPGNN